ncbi:TATA box-binding protein-associated factor RNA polymerase I subunit A isoform X1 [Python bivittatus]|uniref:TATA box-binding protein-associated factor RNA polymerase I subunit A isoform X1 n=1 Tax=Python bivittatus TaxID=176946 RepID=A0A9F5IYE9_PYTBI|nr:TATA box-binding protein-associated factor RNA polymerase I subunit A isoform X1 [Python bivittatus]XP_025025962.1 TATA box-binding protein-associated factor RNA polymerase I subunit A isoform X1 [Python bivittatus]
MDNFVEELRQERSWLSTEEETEDVSTANALLSGIYLPLLPRYFHHPRNSGVKPSEFQKVKEDCLCCIQDALLQSQWQRAAELMISYLEMLENTTAEKRVAAQEEIWRIGTEILQQHPQSNIEESNYFADRMKNLGVKRYLKISLEHAFHLLCSGFLDEAYQNLILAESWRYGEETVAQEKELKLVQAYKGLLDYYTWLKKKTDLLMLDEDSYTRSSLQQEMHGLYQQAKGSLKEIIRIPGVWDPFVICYVDLLEHYKEYEEAREVLSDYAYNSRFPSNPNAHVYYYQFLKRRGESRKAQISALQILHELVPSHELMLEFYNLLKKSKKRKKHKLQLKVIFAALDFAGWKENIKAWSYLAKQTVEILQNSDKQFHWLKKEWDTRKDWWPAFHFSPYLAKNNWQENKKLACEKVLIAGILLGKDCKYFKYVTKEGCKVQKKKFRQLKKFVKEHSWVSLRLADT